MIVYLSAAFHRRKEMQEIRRNIEGFFNNANPAGTYVQVLSRWLNEPLPKDKRECAFMDKRDVEACDVLVRFSDDLNWRTVVLEYEPKEFRATKVVPAAWATGARMEETGMAEAWGKTIVIVGGKQSVFDNLPSRVQLADTKELYKWLGMT
jgi:hypothetical protein